jgi:hypothetical protein
MDDERTPLSEDVRRLRSLIDGVSAPGALRAAIAEQRERTAPRRALRRRMRGVGALAGAAAALGAVVALVAPSGDAPTVLGAAALGARPAAAAAPPVDPVRRSVLRASVDGVRFPAWGPRQRWAAVGTRADELDGRATRTVLYAAPDGTRLGYTIVAGAALPWPAGARAVRHHGVEVRVVRRGARRIAAWRVAGHTCVLSAPATVTADRLVALAASATYG